VIESVFGKMKRLEQNQAKNGFTVFILGIAAMVAETTGEVVQKALETVKISAVNDWFKKNIARSVQAKRVAVNRMIKNRQQKQEQLCIG
jgi:UDP-N-acetyl-D-mannosaminuronic acid transferase (WecB/TagA/CpsF family)